jgi:ubiquitin C-terminal hydrolase
MKKRATKKLDLWKLPNILIFHLKRFAFNETRKEKLDTKVEFPLTDLNIDHYVVNKHKENLIYDLIGVCNHYGSLMGGHCKFQTTSKYVRWNLKRDLFAALCYFFITKYKTPGSGLMAVFAGF